MPVKIRTCERVSAWVIPTAEKYLRTYCEKQAVGVFEIRVGRSERQDPLTLQESFAKGIRDCLEMEIDSCLLDLSAASEFNTMFREDTQRRFITVDRPWMRNDEDWGIAFNWNDIIEEDDYFPLARLLMSYYKKYGNVYNGVRLSFSPSVLLLGALCVATEYILSSISLK